MNNSLSINSTSQTPSTIGPNDAGSKAAHLSESATGVDTTTITRNLTNTHEKKREKPISFNKALIIYAFAYGLNKITFGKIECLKAHENQSAKRLLQAASNEFSQQVNSAILEQSIKAKVQINDLKANQGGITGWVKSLSGFNGALDVGDAFLDTIPAVLAEGEGKQTVLRLLDICGIAYQNHEGCRKLIDAQKEMFLNAFFDPKEGILLNILKDRMPHISSFIVKLLGALHVKNVIDHFLTEHILKNPDAQKFNIIQGQDDYKKLMLKGMDYFMEVGGKDLKDISAHLDDEMLKNQLTILKKAYQDSALTQFGVGFSRDFLDKVITKLNEKNIFLGNMSQKDITQLIAECAGSMLKEKVFSTTQTTLEYAQTGIDMAKNIASEVGAGIKIAADTVSSVANATVEIAKTGVQTLTSGAQHVAQAAGAAIQTGVQAIEDSLSFLCDFWRSISSNESSTPQSEVEHLEPETQTQKPEDQPQTQALTSPSQPGDVTPEPVEVIPETQIESKAQKLASETQPITATSPETPTDSISQDVSKSESVAEVADTSAPQVTTANQPSLSTEATTAASETTPSQTQEGWVPWLWNGCYRAAKGLVTLLAGDVESHAETGL